MKNIIILILFTLVGCQNYHCPEFDSSHQINKWSWFPDSKLSYLYTNEANEEKSLVQTHHRMSYAREFECHSCACLQQLHVDYQFEDSDVVFKCALEYWCQENGTYPDKGYMSLGVDSIRSQFTENENTILEVESHPSVKMKFDITNKETLSILGKQFDNTTELTIKDTSATAVRKIWLRQNEGIIGFKINNQDWVRK